MLNTTIVTLDVKDHIRASSRDGDFAVRVEGEAGWNGLTLGFSEDGLPIIDRLIAELEKVRGRLQLLDDAEQARRERHPGLSPVAVGDQSDGAFSIADYDNRPEA